ncbi:MAG TPA: hypothetical protein VL551_13755 [Actinospica sp.]|jgi:hypothetical protein|nr:hypothetical protein [Actinospica sp.]
MSGQNEQALFDTDPSSGTGETAIEQAVRATLEQHATAVPPQDPPAARLLSSGRARRRRRDALTLAGAIVVVAAGVVGVHAAGFGTSGRTTPAAPSVVSTTGASRPAVYHATVPKNWKPGTKLPLNTYSSVPSWVQAQDAAADLASDKSEGHHVNLGVSPEPTMCLTLGSNPIAWPEGYYAEGSPLVVFDPKGRPVYVVDQGFTGVDGPAKLGFGDGVRLLPGLDMSHCAAQAGSGLKPYTLAMIFADTPRQ